MADETKIDDGGPAFPCGSGDMRDPYGMTLRQYYAGLAMQGVLSDYEFHHNMDYEEIARVSVRLADALIAKLKKGGA